MFFLGKQPLRNKKKYDILYMCVFYELYLILLWRLYLGIVMPCMVYDVLTFTIHRTLSFIWNVEQNSVTLSTSWLGFLFLFTHEEKIISYTFFVTGIPILSFVCLTGSRIIFWCIVYMKITCYSSYHIQNILAACTIDGCGVTIYIPLSLYVRKHC